MEATSILRIGARQGVLFLLELGSSPEVPHEVEKMRATIREILEGKYVSPEITGEPTEDEGRRHRTLLTVIGYTDEQQERRGARTDARQGWPDHNWRMSDSACEKQRRSRCRVCVLAYEEWVPHGAVAFPLPIDVREVQAVLLLKIERQSASPICAVGLESDWQERCRMGSCKTFYANVRGGHEHREYGQFILSAEVAYEKLRRRSFWTALTQYTFIVALES